MVSEKNLNENRMIHGRVFVVSRFRGQQLDGGRRFGEEALSPASLAGHERHVESQEGRVAVWYRSDDWPVVPDQAFRALLVLSSFFSFFLLRFMSTGVKDDLNT